jgi:hypothetical protein
MWPDPPADPDGAIAQLGERLLCKQEVVGSIPSGSTKLRLVSPAGFVGLFVLAPLALRANGLAPLSIDFGEEPSHRNPFSTRHPAGRSVRISVSRRSSIARVFS